MGNKAYRLRIVESDDEDNISNTPVLTRLSKLQLSEENYASDYESDGFTDSDDDRLSHTQTPPPDDTKRKFIFCYSIFKFIIVWKIFKNVQFLEQYLTI